LRSFKERIATLKQQQRELQELTELRTLENKVNAIEQRLTIEESLADTPPPASNTSVYSTDTNEEQPAQQQRFDDNTPATFSHRPKIKKIPVFKGKGIQEYYNFKAQLQIAFQLDPAAFTIKDQKIAFTLQYLQATFRQL
jgi:hypothetical protein